MLKIIVGLIIFIAGYGIVKSISGLIPNGLILLILFFTKKNNKFTRTISIYGELVALVMISIFGIVIFFFPSYWNLWESLLLNDITGLICIILIGFAFNIQKLPTLIRNQFVALRFFSLFIVLVIILNEYDVGYYSDEVFKYYFFASHVVLILILPISLKSLGLINKLLDNTDQLKELENRFEGLSSIRRYLGQDITSNNLRDSMNRGFSALNSASNMVHTNRFLAAQSAMIHAESELNYIEKILLDDFNDSLKEEAFRRLKSIKYEFRENKENLKKCLLHIASIDELEKEIVELESLITNTPEKLNSLIDLHSIIEGVNEKIKNIKTSLRFYFDKENDINQIYSELETHQEIELIAQRLEYDTKKSNDLYTNVNQKIIFFLENPKRYYTDLIVEVREIFDSYKNYNQEIASLKSIIEQNNIIQENNSIRIVVPKYCKSNIESKLLVLKKRKNKFDKINFSSSLLKMNKSLIDFRENQEILDEISFNGIKNGKALLNVEMLLKDNNKVSEILKYEFRIQIFSSNIELFKNYAIVLPFFSGLIGFLCFYFFNLEISNSILYGSISGALITIFIFVFSMMKRPKSVRNL